MQLIDDRPQQVTIRVSGNGARRLFANEAGGHRWQRIPPTERRGRVHSSTVTVAVMTERRESSVKIDERDIEMTFTKGSGPGGQHRNKTSSVAVLKHKPSGIVVRCETERSQAQNRANALQMLQARLDAAVAQKSKSAEDHNRRILVGSGERSDKIRTVQMQNGQVMNDKTGRKTTVKDYLRNGIKAIA